MLSCATPSEMPPARHPSPNWNMPTVKSEPTDYTEDSFYLKEQYHTNSFYNESSKVEVSNGHSTKSEDNVEPFNENYSLQILQKQLNSGMRLQSYQNIAPYNRLISQIESRTTGETHYLPNQNSYSPRHSISPTYASTPIANGSTTPPDSRPSSSSPPTKDQERHSPKQNNDSGYDATPEVKITDKNTPGVSEESEGDINDEPGIRTPALNSHGKMKVFKCKQCKFVANTKVVYWDHCRIHIKPEKLLTCERCPFVTEYRHHLEYHIYNHDGTKPYKCPKCKYVCVNKSMLNSHLKSHSSVYQYRCRDCDYNTKYCHSLKMHLRKQGHEPGIVLNQDGTINTQPVIDVYGTRRGPKQKSINKIYEQMSPPIKQMPPQQSPEFSLANLRFPLPYVPPFLPSPYLFPPNNSYTPNISPPLNELFNRNEQTSPNHSILQQRLSHSDRTSEAIATTPPITSPTVSNTQSPSATLNDALDLTRDKITEKVIPSASSPTMQLEQLAPVTPTTSSKNRRKGVAFKLQPAALRMQHESAKVENIEESDANMNSTKNTSLEYDPACRHCDITFKSVAMYSIHMGYHGFDDPLKCNKCGKKCEDALSFYIHLGRAEHA